MRNEFGVGSGEVVIWMDSKNPCGDDLNGKNGFGDYRDGDKDFEGGDDSNDNDKNIDDIDDDNDYKKSDKKDDGNCLSETDKPKKNVSMTSKVSNKYEAERTTSRKRSVAVTDGAARTRGYSDRNKETSSLSILSRLIVSIGLVTETMVAMFLSMTTPFWDFLNYFFVITASMVVFLFFAVMYLEGKLNDFIFGAVGKIFTNVSACYATTHRPTSERPVRCVARLFERCGKR